MVGQQGTTEWCVACSATAPPPPPWMDGPKNVHSPQTLSALKFVQKLCALGAAAVPMRTTCSCPELSFFSLESCLIHTGKPKGVAVCITWFQTQLILATCQIRYHSHLWDHRRTGQL